MFGFGFIRRHQKLVFGIVIAFTVVAFVFTFNPGAKMGDQGGGHYSFGRVNGQPVTQADFTSAQAETMLSYYFNRGQWPDQDSEARQAGFNLQRETYFRLFLIQQAQELGIAIGEDTVGREAALYLRSLGRNGTTVSPEDFEKQVLKPKGLNLAHFKSFLRHEAAIHQLVTVRGLSGLLIPPQQVAALYRSENEELATEAVIFSASNYLASVTLTPADLEKYYSNSIADYRIPDRRQVSYVKFPASDFTAEADRQIAAITNFDDLVAMVYLKNGGSNSTKYAGLTQEAAYKQIRAEEHQSMALRAARNVAVEFTDTLFTNNPVQAEQLGKLAAARNLKAGITAPFTEAQGPVELEVPMEFARQAFALTAEDPIVGPIIANDGVYVIALTKLVPSELPPLEQVKAQVTENCKLAAAITLARRAAVTFGTVLTNGLAAGKDFAAVAAADKHPVVKLPPFSMLTQTLPAVEEHMSLSRLQQEVAALPNGGHTSLMLTSDGAMIVQVLNRIPANETKMQSELPTFQAQMSRARLNEAFQFWFGNEVPKALSPSQLGQETAMDAKQP